MSTYLWRPIAIIRVRANTAGEGENERGQINQPNNNSQVDNTEHLEIVMLTYNPLHYSNNSAKKRGCLWQYHKDIWNDDVAKSESFKFKAKIIEETPADGNTKSVEILELLKYLINFLRTLEMSFIISKTNLQLIWSAKLCRY